MDFIIFETEIHFSSSRSSGPGGQNVNKVNSKVTGKLDLLNSTVFTSEQKEVLLKKLQAKLTVDGVLIVSSQDKRSQLDNKKAVIDKFRRLISKALEKKKIRKTTKPSRSSLEKRITKKKLVGEKKKWRQKPF
jgi:ribosome-associated protein